MKILEDGKVLNQLRKDIAKVKGRLIKKVEKRGIYEDFGQKEYRELLEKYSQYQYYEEITRELNEFEEWIENYGGW